MSRILWLRPEGRSIAADLFERATGIRVAVHSKMPAAWDEMSSRIRLIFVELPIAAQILHECFAEAQNSSWPIHIVLYDPQCTFDEEAVAPPLGNFVHITEPLTDAQLSDLAGSELQRAADYAWNAGRTKEIWRDMLIGESRAMQLLHSMIRLVGPRRSTVLISGETGTGKEMVARAIHLASSRAGSRMISVNCAAIPENLFESELFGHSKGAFTGAVADRVGRFEQAHRGTIFLDEIAEVPLEIQPKLLRVLQEREIQRVGGSSEIQVDTRVVAATNRNLEQAAAERRFREDLLYRLNVVPIVVPPLRERASDIPLLAEHFVEKICRREDIRPKTLSPDALRRLVAHAWPGNVRQLEHVIEMAVTFSGDRARLYAGDIRIGETRREMPAPSAEIAPLPPTSEKSGGINLEQTMVRVEQLLIQEALRQCGGNKAKAASSLGIPRTTLIYKLRGAAACA